MASSPLVADSNPLAKLQLKAAGLIAECGVLSRLGSPANKDVICFNIAMDSASPIGPYWQGASGPIEEAILRAQLPPDVY